MSRIVKGIFGGSSSSEKILRRFQPAGFTSGGASATFADNRFTLTRSPERIQALEGVVSGFDRQAEAFRGLRGEVAPGFGRLTRDITETLGASLRERIAGIRGEGRRTVGNIRENLARRRLAGSSFQASEVASAEAEFTKREDEARAESGRELAQARATAFLQEVDLSRDLIQREFQSSVAASQAVLQDLNFDTALVAQLTAQASELLNANLMAQAEARAAQQAAGEDFLGTLMGSTDPLGSMMGAGFGGAAQGGGGGGGGASGAAGGIASLFSMFSDRKLKKDVRAAGKTPNGTPLYRFRYLWENERQPDHLGIMADEVEHIVGAVSSDPSGFAKVDYDKVLAYG